ncbi:MAG: cytochrome c maturation protein CcmE [Bacteroidota bacterium]
MKKTHIIGIVVIAIAIGIIVTAASDSSTYVTFKEAFSMAKEGASGDIHVVGKLKKDAAGHIVGMEYHPQLDPNYFTFVMLDNNNEEHQVVLYKPKPQDFDRSEQIVVIGSVKDNMFVASNILLKCPSKYKDNGKQLTANNNQ